jgi:hypothetical protein
MAKDSNPIILRLDRSKKYATVHGDRNLDDPHACVAYMQDGLPYDAEGVLVPDNGATEARDVVIDNARVRFFPLYTDEMRAKRDRKIERIEQGLPKEEVTELDATDDQEEASEDVNLESWLRGEVRYPPFMIFAACKRRYSKSYSKFRDVIEDLVFDQKIVPEDQLSPDLLRHITQPNA